MKSCSRKRALWGQPLSQNHEVDVLLGYLSEAEAFELQKLCVACDSSAGAFLDAWMSASASLAAKPARTPNSTVPLRHYCAWPNPFDFGDSPKTLDVYLVDATQVIAAQTRVDVAFAKDLIVPAVDDLAGTLEFCMRRNTLAAPHQDREGSTTFVSYGTLNTIARGQSVEKLSEYEYRISVRVNARPNFCEIGVWRGLYVLLNGYHRAIALLRAGHRFIPCIVSQVDSLLDRRISPPLFFPTETLLAARPPMLVDFLDSATRVITRQSIQVLRLGVTSQLLHAAL